MNKIKKKESSFTQVSNSFLRDSNISFKAKGLFCYMFSMSENWNFTLQSIATQQKDGLDSVKSAMDELKQYGYISYEKHSNGSGTYFLNDEPNVENPNVENPNLGKSTLIKKKNLDKNKNNSYDVFINFLKDKCKYKSKITKTKEGKDLFNQIQDKKQLVIDYIKHQEEKKDFAVRVTKFMEDYNTVYKNQDNILDSAYGGWN